MPIASLSTRNYIQQEGYNESKKQKSSVKSPSILKAASISLQKNPLENTNFSIKTGQQGASVFQIIDKTAGRIKDGAPVGAPAFRVDSPHGKVNYNHINTNPEIYNNKVINALDHKKISNVTYNIAKNSDDIAKAVKMGGKAIAVAAVAMDGMEIYNSYKSDGDKIGKNTVKTSAEVAGSWAGGIAGAKYGAMGGASIGTMICPGIGTAIGGFVGGFAGGVAGAFAGRKTGEKIVEELYK